MRILTSRTWQIAGGILLGVAAIGAGTAALAIEDPPKSGVIHQVTIEKFKFVPQTLIIRQGDTVEWINLDIAPHTATGKNDSWDTDKMTKRQSARITFQSSGAVNYFCRYHPAMRGEITIIANSRT